MHTETRAVKAELRAAADTPTIQGTAIVYNQKSDRLYDKRIGWFTEIIKPGALAKTLNSNAEVKADLNHETNKVIGRRSKGTLLMHDTPNGLDVAIMPPDTSWGRDAIEAVRHQDYDGMS